MKISEAEGERDGETTAGACEVVSKGDRCLLGAAAAV